MRLPLPYTPEPVKYKKILSHQTSGCDANKTEE
jgi:hypothetical protein